jgi:hypothetical protein
MNKQWHAKNPMPKHPSKNERVSWHVAHAKMCACRPVPESIVEEVKKLQKKK